MKSEVPSQRFIQAVKGVPQEDLNQKNAEGQPEFDVRAEILRTYETDRKQYYLEDSGKSRGGEIGTQHKGLLVFLTTDLNFQIAESILDYTKFLIELDKKKRQLEHDAKQRGIQQPKLLRSELDLLQRKMKRMSDNYGKLLLAYKSIGQNSEGEQNMENCHSSLQFRTKIIVNQKMDEMFYEFLIKLYISALRKAFIAPEDQQRVSEEVSRLFRGNCFNKSTREYDVKAIEDKWPILKEDLSKNYNLTQEYKRQQFVNKMLERVSIPKAPFKSRQQYSPRGEIRPMYVNFTPIAAGTGRSPLVSLMFPTLKDKITNVERFCEDVGPTQTSLSQGASMRSKPRFLPALELEKIVKLETHNRNSKYSALGGTDHHSHSYQTNQNSLF